MEHPDYNSPTALKLFLEQNNMAMQKKFGQNFMTNPDARKNIIDMLDVEQNMSVWEIGPGLGCMSEEILSRGAKLTVFEIDRGFISFLHQFYESPEKNGSFSIVEGDVLKTWRKQEHTDDIRRLTGNLPYNIAATFIADTITSHIVFDKCVFTVQKEVADRMTALPGTEHYSAYSVLCQWAYDVKSFLTLAPGNFWPKPNVASAAVLMQKKQNPIPCSDPSFFVKLVHALFASRRKTINNNIRAILPKDTDTASLFEKAHLSPSARAEDLSLEQLIELSQTITSGIMDR